MTKPKPLSQSSLTNSSYVSERLGNAAVEYANRKTLPESAMAMRSSSMADGVGFRSW